jgi:hypothetical protein
MFRVYRLELLMEMIRGQRQVFRALYSAFGIGFMIVNIEFAFAYFHYLVIPDPIIIPIVISHEIIPA